MSDLVTVRAENLPARAQWAEGMEMRLPATLAARFRQDGADALRDEFSDTALQMRERGCFIARPPLSTRLPLSYQAVPGSWRRFVARRIGRRARRREAQWAEFPAWPLDLSVDFASDLAGQGKPAFERTPVLLSHDLDTAEGLRNLVSMFLDLEEQVGARSANYIVPCAWTIDRVLLAEIKARGHEIGIHGFDHSNKTAFLPDRQRRERLEAGHRLALEVGGIGYRAPSLLRTPALLRDLASFYRYDSSIPCSGGLFPTPNNGSASARPWKIGSIWELPLTLPRDGSLQFLGFDTDRILATWRMCADTIARSGGIVSLLTHCERGFSGNPAMVAIYRGFLEWLVEDGRFRFVLPRNLIASLDGAAS